MGQVLDCHPIVTNVSKWQNVSFVLGDVTFVPLPTCVQAVTDVAAAEMDVQGEAPVA